MKKTTGCRYPELLIGGPDVISVENPLKLLVEASSRPRMYSPLGSVSVVGRL